MRRRTRCLLPIALAIVSSLVARQAEAQLSAAQQTALLDAHNQVRSDLSSGLIPGQPRAANVNPLIWSTSLAATAQSWAAGCQFAHNPNRGFAGENIFLTSTSFGTAALLQGVNAWKSEHETYTYDTFDSEDSGQGHYTQLVWANTTQVGCGAQQCTGSGVPFSGTFLVCNYSPPGNFTGALPYAVAPALAAAVPALGLPHGALTGALLLMIGLRRRRSGVTGPFIRFR